MQSWSVFLWVTQQIQNCLEVSLKITFREKKHVESVFMFLRKSSNEAADQNTEGRRGLRIKGKWVSSSLIFLISAQMVSHYHTQSCSCPAAAGAEGQEKGEEEISSTEFGKGIHDPLWAWFSARAWSSLVLHGMDSTHPSNHKLNQNYSHNVEHPEWEGSRSPRIERRTFFLKEGPKRRNFS